MMMLGLLCLAGLVLFRAMVKRDEPTLLLGVGLYVCAVIYIATMAPELLSASIVLALVVGALGVARMAAAKDRAKGKPSRLRTFFDH